MHVDHDSASSAAPNHGSPRRCGSQMAWWKNLEEPGLLGRVDKLCHLLAPKVAATLVGVFTRIIRSAKLGQRQPCQIYECSEPESIRRQGALSISGGSYLGGSGSGSDMQKVCVLAGSCSE